MAKKQYRFKQPQLAQRAADWLGQAASVVLLSGAVFEVQTLALQDGRLLCVDHCGLKHSFPLADINEIILNFPVAEHAQTSAD